MDHSPAKPKKKPHPLHNLASCTELLIILLDRAVHIISGERQHAVSKLCEAITNVFKGVQQTKMVHFLVAQLVEPISLSLEVNPAARFNHDVEKKFISMFKSFGTLIEEHYGKKITRDHLDKFEKLFDVSLRSSNKGIRLEAYRLWRSSFSSTASDLKPPFHEVLKKCGLPPASLVELHEDIEESMSLSPKENIPGNLILESFPYLITCFLDYSV